MTPKPILLTDTDATSGELASVQPIPQYTSEELRALGILTHYGRSPYYSLDRAERHALVRSAMALIYSQGVAIINRGLADQPFTVEPMPIMSETESVASIEMTPQELDLARRFQLGLSKIPKVSHGRVNNRKDEANLLAVAIIAKVGLAHADPLIIASLFDRIMDTKNAFLMTIGPRNNFNLPNGSCVNELFICKLLSFYIAANPSEFSADHVLAATDVIKTNLFYNPKRLFSEILQFSGNDLARLTDKGDLDESLYTQGLHQLLRFYKKDTLNLLTIADRGVENSARENPVLNDNPLVLTDVVAPVKTPSINDTDSLNCHKQVLSSGFELRSRVDCETPSLTLGDFKEKLTGLLASLKQQMGELVIKGTKGSNKGSKEFNPKYFEAAKAAEALNQSLEAASAEFFKNPSEDSFVIFKNACSRAIGIAAEELKKHRSIWSKIHPLIKGILGFLAALTVIPALLVAEKSSHGYTQTFFGSPPTRSQEKLDRFRDSINDVEFPKNGKS